MRKHIHLLRLAGVDSVGKKGSLDGVHEFYATWDSIALKEKEIDAELLDKPDYNGSHLRVIEQVHDLIGKTDYPSRRLVERLACHTIVTLSMLELRRDDEFGKKMRTNHKWFVRVWHNTDDGKLGADLRLLAEEPDSLDELPPLDRINVWGDDARHVRVIKP